MSFARPKSDFSSHEAEPFKPMEPEEFFLLLQVDCTDVTCGLSCCRSASGSDLDSDPTNTSSLHDFLHFPIPFLSPLYAIFYAVSHHFSSSTSLSASLLLFHEVLYLVDVYNNRSMRFLKIKFQILFLTKMFVDNVRLNGTVIYVGQTSYIYRCTMSITTNHKIIDLVTNSKS